MLPVLVVQSDHFTLIGRTFKMGTYPNKLTYMYNDITCIKNFKYIWFLISKIQLN